MHTEPSAERIAAYERALAAFAAGSIETLESKTLSSHLVAIANHATGDDAVQARDIIQAITLNHLILQRHVDELERRDRRVQRIVIALAGASLIGTAVQVGMALWG